MHDYLLKNQRKQSSRKETLNGGMALPDNFQTWGNGCRSSWGSRNLLPNCCLWISRGLPSRTIMATCAIQTPREAFAKTLPVVSSKLGTAAN